MVTAKETRKILLPFLLDDIPNPGSRSFCVTENADELPGFVVRQDGQVFGYRNQCPHTGVTLNWSEDVFLDSHEQLIQCALHGALFTIEEGQCIHGPCLGESLQKLRLIVNARGQLLLEI